MRYHEINQGLDIKDLKENSTGGATSSGCVSSVAQPFGSQYPEYSYGGKTFNSKKGKKKDKVAVIKHVP